MAIFNLFHKQPSERQREEQAVHDKLSDENFELV